MYSFTCGVILATAKHLFFLSTPVKMLLQDLAGSYGIMQESCRNFVQESCTKFLQSSCKILQDTVGSCKILQDLAGMQEKRTQDLARAFLLGTYHKLIMLKSMFVCSLIEIRF